MHSAARKRKNPLFTALSVLWAFHLHMGGRARASTRYSIYVRLSPLNTVLFVCLDTCLPCLHQARRLFPYCVVSINIVYYWIQWYAWVETEFILLNPNRKTTWLYSMIAKRLYIITNSILVWIILWQKLFY